MDPAGSQLSPVRIHGDDDAGVFKEEGVGQGSPDRVGCMEAYAYLAI
jgi:hypothetical protein